MAASSNWNFSGSSEDAEVIIACVEPFSFPVERTGSSFGSLPATLFSKPTLSLASVATKGGKINVVSTVISGTDNLEETGVSPLFAVFFAKKSNACLKI